MSAIRQRYFQISDIDVQNKNVKQTLYDNGKNLKN